jgi:SAM-dependent methyltransferase
MRARGIGHRDWHEHRLWEYASVMQQLEELQVKRSALIVDVGSGGSFFPPYLATVGGYPNVTLVDSMVAGDIVRDVTAQRVAYHVDLQVLGLSCEDLRPIPDDAYDVTLCISMIEHVAADQHDVALRELVRITKTGGYLFLTSDYFREGDDQQLAASPWRWSQETAYTRRTVESLPRRVPVDFVGATDLDYRGDFVHNYAFVNVCLRKQ